MAQKRLRTKEFAGDGEPYTEVEVKISIRILGGTITRSRLAVTVYPDPALQELARRSLRAMKIENYGLNQEGVFGVCLSENFNGWEDLDGDYPRLETSGGEMHQQKCRDAMNDSIRKSVEWALEIHRKGMAEAHIDGEGRRVN